MAMPDSDHKQALPPGHQLGRYRLLGVLGVGGFGVTYLGEHISLGHRVAIKEYLPNEFAVREGATVHPKSPADREDFEWGLTRFVDEARTLTRFRHPNLVRVSDYFEANNTAYIVMDYEDGEPLDVLLERHGTLTEAQLKRVLLPVVDGLRQVHAAGFLHRDIKPSNLFVRRSDETPVLLDFGTARQALGRKSKSMTAIASAGYSPPEQYESQGAQGAWTDIYALSALCYRAVTGKAPMEALRRQSQLLRSQVDPLPRLAETAVPAYSQAFLEAVDWGLRVIETERPQSLDEWLARVEDIPAANRRTAPQLSASSGDRTLSGMTRMWSGIRGVFGTRLPTAPSQTEGNWRKRQPQPAAPAPSRLLGPMEYLRRFLGYLRRLVTGGLGLGMTFWLFGVAGSGVLIWSGVLISNLLDLRWVNWWALAFSIAPASLATVTWLEEYPPTYNGELELVVFAVTLFLWSLAVKVGVWRAASAYRGPGGWAVLAKLHILADVLLATIIIWSWT